MGEAESSTTALMAFMKHDTPGRRCWPTCAVTVKRGSMWERVRWGIERRSKRAGGSIVLAIDVGVGKSMSGGDLENGWVCEVFDW